MSLFSFRKNCENVTDTIVLCLDNIRMFCEIRIPKENLSLLLDMYSGQVSHYEINKLLLKVSAIVEASKVAALYNNTNTFNHLQMKYFIRKIK
jgi:hypothetical protein